MARHWVWTRRRLCDAAVGTVLHELMEHALADTRDAENVILACRVEIDATNAFGTKTYCSSRATSSSSTYLPISRRNCAMAR